MTTTCQQIETRLMEMLGSEATEQDAERAFEWLAERGQITRDESGNWTLAEVSPDLWLTLLASLDAVTPDAETGYYTLPALGGEDVTRRRIEILVEVGPDGVARNPAHYDAPWSIIGRDTLRGWGNLDGDCYIVQPIGCAWSVAVPVALWSALPIDADA